MPSNPTDSIRGFSYGTVQLDEWLKMVNDSLKPYTGEVTAIDVDIITRGRGRQLVCNKRRDSGPVMIPSLDYDEYIEALREYEAAQSREEAENTEAQTAVIQRQVKKPLRKTQLR
jgi:hypothetical protein